MKVKGVGKVIIAGLVLLAFLWPKQIFALEWKNGLSSTSRGTYCPVTFWGERQHAGWERAAYFVGWSADHTPFMPSLWVDVDRMNRNEWPVFYWRKFQEYSWSWLTTFNFGRVTTDINNPPKNIVWAESNWVSERFEFIGNRNENLTLFITQLSPAFLIQSNSSKIFFFTELLKEQGPPLHFAIPTEKGIEVFSSGQRVEPKVQTENWLICWFHGQKGWDTDVPFLIVLQHKLESIFLSKEGLELSFKEKAGYILAMPLFGTKEIPVEVTANWEKKLPEDVIRQASFWSKVLLNYPVELKEDYIVDEAKDKVIIRESFKFIEIEDDWKTEPLKYAPVSPAEIIALKEGFPISFKQKVEPLNLTTPFGPWYGVKERNEYTYEISNILKYINEEIDFPETEDTDSTRMLKAGIKEYARTNCNFGVPSAGYEIFAEAMRVNNLAISLPFLKDEDKKMVIQYLRDSTDRFILNPELYLKVKFAGPGDWKGKGYLAEKPLHYKCEPDILQDWALIVSLWNYAHFTGDWLLIKQKWPLIKEIYGMYLVLSRWQNYPEPGKYGHYNADLYFSRLARMLGDRESYEKSSYMFARNMLYYFVRMKGKGWQQVLDPEKKSYPYSYEFHMMADDPKRENCYVPEVYMNAVPELYRFDQDYLKDEIKDVMDKLTERFPEWYRKMKPGSVDWFFGFFTSVYSYFAEDFKNVSLSDLFSLVKESPSLEVKTSPQALLPILHKAYGYKWEDIDWTAIERPCHLTTSDIPLNSLVFGVLGKIGSLKVAEPPSTNTGYPEKDDWPMFGKDPLHSAFYPGKLKLPLKLGWTFETKDFTTASPIISNGILYCGSWDKNMYALLAKGSSENGTLIWKFETGGPIKASASVGHGLIFFGSNDGNIYALSANKGEVVWKIDTGSPVASSPTLAGEKLFIGSDSGYFYAIEAKEGRILWKYKSMDRVRSSPLVSEKTVFFASADGCIYSLNKEDGSLNWKRKLDGQVIDSSPGLWEEGGLVYIGTCSEEEKAYFGEEEGSTLFALKKESGEVAWKFHLSQNIYSSPLVIEGKIYFACNDQHFYCLWASDGKLIWKKQDWSSNLGGIPVAIGENVVAYTNWSYAEGVRVLNRETGNLVSEILYIGAGPTWSNFAHSCPVVVDGWLYQTTLCWKIAAYSSPDSCENSALAGADSYENLALAGTASASSVLGDPEDPKSYIDEDEFLPAKANDGDPETHWAARSNAGGGTWIAIRFPTATTFNGVVINERCGIESWTLQYDAGGSWVDITSGTGIGLYPGGMKNIVFDAVTSREVRLLINSITWCPSVWEFDVYHKDLIKQ